MRLRHLLPLLLGAALGAADVATYELRLDLAPDGSARGTAQVDLTACAPGPLVLPLGLGAVEGLRLEEGPPGTRLEQAGSNGQTRLHLTLPEGVPAQARLRLAFAVGQALQAPEPASGEKASLPKGSRLFRHAFVNTQASPVGTYRLVVLFPAGTRAQAIREALPRLRKGEAGPRARLDRIDGRQGVLLQAASLRQGDGTSLLLELVPERRSPAWLVAGLLLSVLYLVFFRDLVARET